VDLPDEASIKQLNFLSDKILPLNGLLPGLLLDRPSVRVDFQMVLNHLPLDPRYLRQLPGKHVHISPEEGDEREFLFAIQIPHDADGLRYIRPNLNSLHGDVLFAGEMHVGC
jgi:hypothetical protein